MNSEEVRDQLARANDNLGRVLFAIDTLQDNEENRFLKKYQKPVNSAKLNIEFVIGELEELE